MPNVRIKAASELASQLQEALDEAYVARDFARGCDKDATLLCAALADRMADLKAGPLAPADLSSQLEALSRRSLSLSVTLAEAARCAEVAAAAIKKAKEAVS